MSAQGGRAPAAHPRALGPAPAVARVLMTLCVAAIAWYAALGIPQVMTRAAPADPDPATRTPPPALLAQVAATYGPSFAHSWWGIASWQALVAGPLGGEGVRNPAGHVQGTDFLAYYTAGWQVAHGQIDRVYVTAARESLHHQIAGFDTAEFGFAYPPFVLPLLTPLGHLDFQLALWVWLGGMVLVIVAARQWVRPGLVSLLLVLSYPAVVQNLITGQNGALSAALLIAGLGALNARRPILAGALFAALGYKPQLAVLIPLFLLAGREYRAFASLAVTGCAWVALTVMLYGIGPWFAWLDQIRESAGYLTAEAHPFAKVPSVFVFVYRLSLNADAAYIAQLVSGVAGLAVGVWVWRHSRHRMARVMALIGAIGLATPYVYDYDLVILLPVFTGVWDRAMVRGTSWQDYGVLLGLWIAPLALWILVPPLSAVTGMTQPYGVQPGALLFLILTAVAYVRARHHPHPRPDYSPPLPAA